VKIPYSFVQKCNELNVDISTCSLTAYHSHSLLEKNIFFDNSLTIKLKNPIKLNSLNLENINLSAGAYRLIIKDQNNKTLLDEFNVLGISSGGDVNPAFDAIKNSSGVTQFNATTLNKSISFAASGTVSLSFDDISNKITIIGQTGTYSAGTAIKITTGVISVGNIVNGGLLIGAGVNNDTNILVPGITYNSLVIGENGLPSWGTINLTSNSAVSGILSISNGGTGLASLGTLGISILSYSSSSSGLVSWNGSSFSINTNNYLIANQSITLSGDVSGSGATAITVSVNKILGNDIPTNATGVLFNNGSGVLSWVPISGGGGTVASVALSAPSLFTVTGSPIITSGTLGFTWNGASTNFVLADGSTVLRSNYLLSSAISGVVGQVGVFNDTNSISSSNGLTYQFNELGVAGRIVIKDIAGTSSIQLYNTSLKGYDLYYYGEGLNLNEYDTSGTLISSVITIVKGSTGGITIGGISTRPVSITSLTSAAVVKSSSGGTLSNVSGPASNLVLVDGNTIPQSTFITGGPYLPISGGTETGMVTFASGTTSLAPISFQAGSLLTTPVAHHVEWNGSNLYITNSTPTRKQIAYTDSTMTGLWNGIVISPVYGGTGFSTYAIGDILYANTTSSLAKLAAASTGNVLLSGTSPSWGKVGLATHISGVLPIANGGTGLSSLGTLGTAILQYSSPTSGFVKWSGTSYTIDTNSYLTSNQTITLSGDVVGSGVTAISTSILSTVVTGKVLTGYSTGINSTITATDSILGAFGKVQGQINSISTSLGGGPFLPLTAGATKALSGTLYGIGINLTSTTDSPLLITHNLAGAYTHPLQAFNSGMVAGNQYNFDFGQSASTNNAGNFGFKYVGAGSSSNYVTLGLYGANDLLTITAAGVPKFSGLATAGFVRANASGQLSSSPPTYADITGTVPTWNQNTTGSSAKWTTARSISMTGDVSWTVSVDGSANATAAGALASIITAGGPVGSASVVPVVTWDAKGRLTAVSTATITPAAIGAQPAGNYLPVNNPTATGTMTAPIFYASTAFAGPTAKIATLALAGTYARFGYNSTAQGFDPPSGTWGGFIQGSGGDVQMAGSNIYFNVGATTIFATSGTTSATWSIPSVFAGATLSNLTGSTTRIATISATGQIGATSWAYDGPYLPLAGGNLNSGAQIQAFVNIVPSASANMNYNASPLVVNRVSSNDRDYTNVAAIGFHNRGLNAAALYYEATAGTPSFHYNRHDGGIVKIYDSVNLTNLNQLANGPGYVTNATVANVDVTEHSWNNTNYPVVWDNNGRYLFHTAAKMWFNPYSGLFAATAIASGSTLSWGGGILRDYTAGGGTSSALYGSWVGDPNNTNYSLAFAKDGSEIYMRGANNANLVVGSTIIAQATSAGLAVTGAITSGLAAMGTWSVAPDTFAWFGANNQNNGTNGNSGYLQAITNGTLYACAPSGGDFNVQVSSEPKLNVGYSTTTIYNDLAVSNASVTISGGSLVVNGTWFRDQVGNNIKSCIYMPNLSGGAGANNYSFMAWKDGQFAFINGSSAVGLDVNNVDILLASATGIAVTGTASVSGGLSAKNVNLTQTVTSGTTLDLTQDDPYWIFGAVALTTINLPDSPRAGTTFCFVRRNAIIGNGGSYNPGHYSNVTINRGGSDMIIITTDSTARTAYVVGSQGPMFTIMTYKSGYWYIGTMTQG
jgi:hypothetical protein